VSTFVPTLVVGAGYAGLVASHYLSGAGVEHLVLEKGRVGETWRSQRWNSFALNTNNRISSPPGLSPDAADPEGFALRDQLVSRLERYVTGQGLPVRTGVAVTSLAPLPRDAVLRVTADHGGREETFECRSVIVASGFQNEPKWPPARTALPGVVFQVHTAGYRDPAGLPAGAVLVVGGGQSGCQIAEDLLEAGRRVFLSTSMVARVPRRYRGRDIIDWMIDTGFWDVRLRDLEDPAMQIAAQPHISGVGPRGHSVSLQGLARAGAVLVGRLTAAEGTTLYFADDAPACVRFADEKSAAFKRMIDTHIERTGMSAPAPERDPADLPDDGSACRRTVARLDLRRDGIGAIIWCTGFRGSLGWIHAPAVDEDGRPAQVRGVSAVPGIYFLGAPWLHKRKSGVLYGMHEDAEFIVQHITDRTTA